MSATAVMPQAIPMPLPAPRAWWQRYQVKLSWKWLGGGYLIVNVFGIWFFQRIRTWGVAIVGLEKEFILRFELALRKVDTHSLVHVDLLDLTEARLWIVDFKVWRQVALFFIVNLGARLTKASREIRAQEAGKLLQEQARRSLAARVNARRVPGRGHPWSPARH